MLMTRVAVHRTGEGGGGVALSVCVSVWSWEERERNICVHTHTHVCVSDGFTYLFMYLCNQSVIHPPTPIPPIKKTLTHPLPPHTKTTQSRTRRGWFI